MAGPPSDLSILLLIRGRPFSFLCEDKADLSWVSNHKTYAYLTRRKGGGDDAASSIYLLRCDGGDIRLGRVILFYILLGLFVSEARWFFGGVHLVRIAEGEDVLF